MDCMRAQKLIRPYLENQLSDRELGEFLDHIGSCRECRDELETYFAIYQTLGDDADDGDYNFSRKLDERLRNSGQYLKKRHITGCLTCALVIAAELIFVAALSGVLTGQLEEARERAGRAPGMETESEYTETVETETERADE